MLTENEWFRCSNCRNCTEREDGAYCDAHENYLHHFAAEDNTACDTPYFDPIEYLYTTD